MADKMTTAELAQRVKAKYPQYSHIPDEELAEKVLAKYPEYHDSVDANSQFRGKGSFINPAYEKQVARTAVTHPENDKPGRIQNFINTNNPDRESDYQNPVAQQIQKFGRGFARTGADTFLHPINALKGAVTSALRSSPPGEALDLLRGHPTVGQEMGEAIHAHPADALGGMAAQAVIGKGLDLAGEGIPKAASGIRTAAIGDPDVAALKGLRVGATSKKGISTINSVEGARPFLKGVTSQEDLQNRIPVAKNEIWGPYKKTIDAISDRRINGPDGPTTIGDLEAERLKTSANLRTLKSNTPEAIQLAQQKGMSQAELLQRESAIKAAMDPHLQQAGIDPTAIRKAFGQVASVGEKVSGRTTLAEPSKPYGVGKMLSSNPFTSPPSETLGNLGTGFRDIAAGRPLWSGKPTDVAIKDAFRSAGPKPDFRAPVSGMAPAETPSLRLPSETIGNADVSPSQGMLGGHIRGNTTQVGKAPPSRLALPSSASSGEPQPMIGVLKHPGEQRSFDPETTRIQPPKFAQPEILPPSRTRSVTPQGEVGPPAPRGLLTGAQEPVPPPAPSDVHIYPPGSAYRNAPVDGAQMYPPGSQFRGKIPPFNLEEYLRGQQ